MISFFVGVPGSGKTYFSVDKIYNNFSADKEAKKDKNSTYEICYTNINEFKFGKVENVFPLDFDDLKDKLTLLHGYYKDKESDDFLIEKCKEYNIYNTLFVVDECHNFFDVKDAVLVWWLSYHRHLFHEIILITQNLSLVESKYKSFGEFFYKAFPQSLTLIKTHFKYNVYCSSRMSQNSKSGSIKIKRNKKVFELYKSGDSINTQNIIFKFILFSIVVFLVLSIFFYFFVLKKSVNDVVSVKEETVTLQQDNNVTDRSKNNVTDLQEKTATFNISGNNKFLVLNCNSASCYNEDIDIPPALVTAFVKSKNLNILHVKTINDNFYKFYLDTTKEFYEYLKREVTENEKIADPISKRIFPIGDK